MLLVAEYCIYFQEDQSIWGTRGCYGYPAALLLLSIVDSIGSYVLGGNVKNHFRILNEEDYYGLNLSEEEVDVVYHYRNKLSHNAVMKANVGLRTGTPQDRVLQNENGRYWLNLIPFYFVSVKAVNNFLDNPAVLVNNQMILRILGES